MSYEGKVSVIILKHVLLREEAEVLASIVIYILSDSWRKSVNSFSLEKIGKKLKHFIEDNVEY